MLFSIFDDPQISDHFFDSIVHTDFISREQDCQEVTNSKVLLKSYFYVVGTRELYERCEVTLKSKSLQILSLVNSQAKIFINLDFSYLRVLTSKQNEKIGFSIERNGNQFAFTLLKECINKRDILKLWLKKLNSLVIRLGLLKKYHVIQEIGQGSQARVLKVGTKDKSNQQSSFKKFYAMKIFDKAKLQSGLKKFSLWNEIRNQRALLGSEYVVKILKIFENNKFINLLLEYEEGGVLSQYIKKSDPLLLSEKESLQICSQLLLASHEMKIRNIVHCDLKPENILIHLKDDRNFMIKIADFGFSRYQENFELQQKAYICGTPGYFAPESLRKKIYSDKSDIFSIGVILYNLLTGKTLFNGKTKNEILEKNKSADNYHLTKDLIFMPQEIRLLLLSMLQEDPKHRISAIEALNSHCFQDYQLSHKLPITKQVKNPKEKLRHNQKSVITTSLNSDNPREAQNQIDCSISKIQNKQNMMLQCLNIQVDPKEEGKILANKLKQDHVDCFSDFDEAADEFEDLPLTQVERAMPNFKGQSTMMSGLNFIRKERYLQ